MCAAASLSLLRTAALYCQPTRSPAALHLVTTPRSLLSLGYHLWCATASRSLPPTAALFCQLPRSPATFRLVTTPHYAQYQYELRASAVSPYFPHPIFSQ